MKKPKAPSIIIILIFSYIVFPLILACGPTSKIFNDGWMMTLARFFVFGGTMTLFLAGILGLKSIPRGEKAVKRLIFLIFVVIAFLFIVGYIIGEFLARY